MNHIWIRAEQRENERRTGITPDGVRALIDAGLTVTVEDSEDRVISTADYASAGAAIARAGSWPEAPRDAIIFGLKELPDDDTPLPHTHIMFGHAFKGQPAGQRLLSRFRAGNGRLLDLEYLVDTDGRRVAAFGYWAGYAGAAVALTCWSAQKGGSISPPIRPAKNAAELRERLSAELAGNRPSVIVIGALGRVGTGASDLCSELGLDVTRWDLEETRHGGPYPEILDHEIFLNCIFASPGTPVFVPRSALTAARKLTVIGDISCDPDSDFSPIKVYDRTTTWVAPALRVSETPPLDVTAIDNLPSLLPLESSQDYAGQLLPTLLDLPDDTSGVWARAKHSFAAAMGTAPEEGARQ